MRSPLPPLLPCLPGRGLLRRAAVAAGRGALGLLLGILMSTPVHANPFSIAHYNGLSGGPFDQSPFALYWNPSQLSAPGARLALHGLLVNRRASYDRAPTDPDAPPEVIAANSGVNYSGATGVVPGAAFAYGGEASGLRWGTGFGTYIARAGIANWERPRDYPGQFPGAIDGPQRWNALNTSMLIITHSAGFSLGTDRFSVGAALRYNQVTLSTTRASNPSNPEALVDVEGRIAEGRLLLKDAEGEALLWTVGLTGEVSDALALALSWRQGTSYTLQGRAFLTIGTADETNFGAEFPLQVADIVCFGAAWKLSDTLRLRPEVEWAGWSVMDEQVAVNTDDPRRPELLRFERNFSDTWALRLRSDHTLSETFTLHGGLAFETGATPEETFEPGLAESDQVIAGAGFSWRVSEHLMLRSSFQWQYFRPMEITESIQKPQARGSYTDQRQYLNLDLEFFL